MTLLWISLLLFAGLTVLFWAGSLVIQGYLYSEPAERLGLRAAASSAVMTLLFSFWTYLDQQSPDRYQTFFTFSAYDIQEVDQFTAIRASRSGQESRVPYQRAMGSSGNQAYRNNQDEVFTRSSADWLVTAIEIDHEGQPLRFEAVRQDGSFIEPVTFAEVDGDRYMLQNQLGQVVNPRSDLLLANLVLNLFQFVLWFLVFWIGLQYQPGHAVFFALFVGLAFMLIVLPVLFSEN